MIALLLVLQFAIPRDTGALHAAATMAGVPPVVMYAVAWQESRDGRLGNAYRGAGREQCDSTGCRRVCREIGRMQLNPCIRYPLPACDSLRVYWANLRCGAAVLHFRRAERGSWALAIRAYNGSGPAADRYLRQVLAYVGWWALQEEGM